MDQTTPEKIAEVAHRLSCRSVAYTYNDPVIFLEYAVDVAQACRARNIKSVAVTAGYICAQARKEVFSYMDAVNVDLKAFSEGFYRRLCSGQLRAILDTLIYIKHHTQVWLEITTLLIPDKMMTLKNSMHLARGSIVIWALKSHCTLRHFIRIISSTISQEPHIKP